MPSSNKRTVLINNFSASHLVLLPCPWHEFLSRKACWPATPTASPREQHTQNHSAISLPLRTRDLQNFEQIDRVWEGGREGGRRERERKKRRGGTCDTWSWLCGPVWISHSVHKLNDMLSSNINFMRRCCWDATGAPQSHCYYCTYPGGSTTHYQLPPRPPAGTAAQPLLSGPLWVKFKQIWVMNYSKCVCWGVCGVGQVVVITVMIPPLWLNICFEQSLLLRAWCCRLSWAYFANGAVAVVSWLAPQENLNLIPLWERVQRRERQWERGGEGNHSADLDDTKARGWRAVFVLSGKAHIIYWSRAWGRSTQRTRWHTHRQLEVISSSVSVCKSDQQRRICQAD